MTNTLSLAAPTTPHTVPSELAKIIAKIEQTDRAAHEGWRSVGTVASEIDRCVMVDLSRASGWTGPDKHPDYRCGALEVWGDVPYSTHERTLAGMLRDLDPGFYPSAVYWGEQSAAMALADVATHAPLIDGIQDFAIQEYAAPIRTSSW